MKVNIEFPIATRHRRDMTEKFLKATLNPNKQQQLNMVKQSDSTIWLLGDFNLPKIDWGHQMPKPDCSHPTFYSECLGAFSDCLLEQIVTSPTRCQNIIDLFFTTNPTLIDKVSILPGLADHYIV